VSRPRFGSGAKPGRPSQRRDDRGERPDRGGRKPPPKRRPGDRVGRDERPPRRDDRGGRDDRPQRRDERPRTDERPRRDERPREDDRGRRAPPTEGIVWGLNPVLEYLRAKPNDVERILVAEGALDRGPAAEVFSRARDAKIQVDKVDRERLNRISSGGVHQGVVAEVKQYQYLELSTLTDRALAAKAQPLLVLLDGVQDPHNFGAIVRSAHALGAQGVIVAKDRAAQVTGSVVKAAAGALAHCPVARVTNLSRALEELRDKGFWSAVLVPEGGKPLSELKLDGPLVLVVGSEGDGVRPLVASKCDYPATIPMEGRVGSLNASVSAAIALYEIARQRAAAAVVQSP
jgi:23S rRNA (guanosine2251-2'-O)-methyltransferase